jgi:GTP-binding protein EngB required for normal cell division/uncharacterized protein (DUF697 family)
MLANDNQLAKYSLDEIIKLFIEKSQEAKKQLGTFNIIIIGRAGVGKSTLVNQIFQLDLAKEGVGQSVTKQLKQYNLEDCPITIYDTPGLELDEQQAKQVKNDVAELIKNLKDQSLDKHIHIVWYCVSDLGKRFEASEEDWIRTMSNEEEISVIMVLTQTYEPQQSEMLPYLQGLKLPVNVIVPILAKECKITRDYTIQAYGLNNLVEQTATLIPEQAERAFIHQQVASINLQAIQSDKYLIGYVAGSAIIGATEAALANIGALLGLQLTMLAQITVIFGIDFDKEFYTILITSIAGSKATEEIGKIFIQELLKWMGVSAIAAPITATIAATMTLSLGRAYIEGIKWYKLALAKEENVSPEQLATKVKEIYKNLTSRSKDNN